MKLRLFHCFLLPLSFMVSLPSNASNEKTLEECKSKYSELAELSQCLDIVKRNVDKELQTWINNQTFILEEHALETGRRSALEMFKRSQRNFITFRTNNCRWQYLYISPDVNAANAFKECYIKNTQRRIKELHELSM